MRSPIHHIHNSASWPAGARGGNHGVGVSAEGAEAVEEVEAEANAEVDAPEAGERPPAAAPAALKLGYRTYLG